MFISPGIIFGQSTDHKLLFITQLKKKVLSVSWIKSCGCQLKEVYGSLGIRPCNTFQNYDIFRNIFIFLSYINKYRF